MFEKLVGLSKVFKNSLRVCGCVFAYVCAIVTDGCCSRPTLLALEQTLHFPTNRKSLLVIPEEDVSHHQQHLGNIW